MIDEERQHDFVDAPQPMQRNAFGHQRGLSKEQIHQCQLESKLVMHFKVIINGQGCKSYPVVAVQKEYDAEKLCIQLVVIGRRVKKSSVGFGQVPQVLSNAINFLGLQSHHITFCLT